MNENETAAYVARVKALPNRELVCAWAELNADLLKFKGDTHKAAYAHTLNMWSMVDDELMARMIPSAPSTSTESSPFHVSDYSRDLADTVNDCHSKGLAQQYLDILEDHLDDSINGDWWDYVRGIAD